MSSMLNEDGCLKYCRIANLQETLNTRKQKTDSENPYNRLLGLKFKNKFKKKFENKLKTS